MNVNGTLACRRAPSRGSAPHRRLLLLAALAAELMLAPRAVGAGLPHHERQQRPGHAHPHSPAGDALAPKETGSRPPVTRGRHEAALPAKHPTAPSALATAAPALGSNSHLSGGNEPEEPHVQPLDAIGSLSVGHPHAGYLFNAVQMPAGRQWLLSVPDQAWGTEETIAALIHCIHRVNERFPNSPPAIIGSISAQHGGALPPHKSHRTGRDADVHFYLTQRGPRWYEPATAENLDRPRTWALLRAIVTETDVEYVLIDRSVQALLEEYALGVESDRAWVADLFHGSAKHPNPLVKHIPGHTGHMHIRFFNPIAQERGRRAYERLVEQGHIRLERREVKYKVEPGDTLSELAQLHRTSVDEIIRRNKLEGTAIIAGAQLVIEEPRELRGARDRVILPARRLPRQSSIVASLGQLPVKPVKANPPAAPASDIARAPAPAGTSPDPRSMDVPNDSDRTIQAALIELERHLELPK
jgi:LysM repeat protein/murein endopeptidase